MRFRGCAQNPGEAQAQGKEQQTRCLFRADTKYTKTCPTKVNLCGVTVANCDTADKVKPRLSKANLEENLQLNGSIN